NWRIFMRRGRGFDARSWTSQHAPGRFDFVVCEGTARMSVVDQVATQQALEQLLAERILLLDGAMGTMVHALGFGEREYRGRRFAGHSKDLKNFIDILSVTQPEAIE